MDQYANLFEAILNNDTKHFCSLLECITWPRTTDYLDFELITTALEFGRVEIANHLLNKKCRIIVPQSEIHLLHLALTNNDFYDIVKRLLALGASVSAKNSRGDNAIHIAFINKAPEQTIDMLLLKYLEEINENAKNEDGLSVLHVLCTRPNLFVIKKFIGNQSNNKEFVQDNLNCQVNLHCNSNYAGYTPLHFAVSYGRKEIMKYLVMNFNVDAFIQDANNSTPIHLALERRDVHAIDLIMAYNFPKVARKDVVNNLGLSHFMAACTCLIQDFAMKFMELANERSAESLVILINRQVYFTKEGVNQLYAGYAPIHFASEFGRSNTVQQLVYFGASFFTKTAKNFSPLVLALKHGNDEIARLIFWCYKQYRNKISTDKVEDSDYGCSEKSLVSEHWYPCKTHFSAANS